MSTNPNRDQQSGASNNYGGYSGYMPSNPADDPYGSRSQQSGPGTQQNDPSYVYGQQQQQQQYYNPGAQQQQQQQYYNPGGQQQSNAYIPPSSVHRNRGANSSQSVVDARARRLAFLSYLGGCFTGIFFFFVGRKNRFVRFHAAQSIVLFTPLLIAYILLKLISSIIIIGILVSPIITLISIVGFILWIGLMIQAYLGATVKLPFVGKYAEALVNRFSK
jgi:uncharacterized membrane protein